MYPSFTSTYIQPTFSSYTTHEPNLSKTPHFISLGDQDQSSTIFNQQLQHPANNLFSDHHSNHKTNTNNVAAADHHHEIRATGDDDNNSKKMSSSSKRRRSAGSRNDRHSKINTAQGPRDRRMRLSLEVARKFFKLQDILGFDKASKTVEWLLMKSESNIQQLLPPPPNEVSESSTSRCEEEVFPENKKKSSSSSNRKNDKKKLKTIINRAAGVRRKSLYLAKETREMARKRARERTVEKSSSKIISGCVNEDQKFAKFRPCLNQETDSLGSWIINQPDHQVVLQPAASSSQYFQLKQGVIDGNSSSVIGNWNLSSLLNFQHTGVLHANDQQHQLNDFQILGNNLWEAGYN